MKYKNLKVYLVVSLKIILVLHMMYFKIKVYFLGLDTTPTKEAIDEAKEVFKSSAREAGKRLQIYKQNKL